ncbi:PVC-type heme-binding CxxCH protein [Prosthecobacter vanneervenii]|uniref:Putative membrane-bound dehydrogenase-like protein n=1 Tax=Prosthecobacter vanneervenii TaxID=48466 RepID=A0A7W7YBP2_9BACT|nr:PVC-type heme-binding CxxCH protein [Prosthecobacter vanneervenii]MBB5033223.1 putative membrane-bound dehydrogenase-like protein [Prosthecobacter vanneervenii]
MKNLRHLALALLLPLPCLAADEKPAKAPKATPIKSPLELHRWSGTLNVPDPVAVTVDPQGRIYVSATTRRKVADLDIREHTQWIPDDVALTSVEEKEAFLKRELAPGKTRLPRGGLADHNKDGSIDWKDLTVHSERIYQLCDTDHDGTADKITTFAEGFNSVVTGIAAGILYHDGWVYVTVAPDLVRLRDTNDDGVADEREIVAHGFGMHIAYAGHDMHGPRIGPDGRIYWSIGDKGVNVTSKEGKHFYYPHEGCVMRCEPDGSHFEVFAHGLRNIQEIAFDDYGNMFGVDNDADLPGERERFVYITELSDSGWRCSHQYQKEHSRWIRDGIWQPAHPGQPLFITPPLANYSNGPAGFIHEPGTALGTSLRGHFILDQFPSGQMTAFQIVPSGSTFKMQNERLIHSGLMGIGLAVAPTGELIIADWDGGYPLDEKGAIWFADDPTGKNSTERQETQKLLTSENLDPTHLSHPDQRVRLQAQFTLVKKGDYAVLQKTALDKKAPRLARIHAIWGLGQGMRFGKVEAATLLPLIAESDTEIVISAVKMLSDVKTSGAPLVPLLTHSSQRVRFHAAIALGKLAEPTAVKALLGMAAQESADPYMRHAIVTGLAGCADEATLAKHTNDKQSLCCLLALARNHSPLVAAFLTHKTYAAEAERAIHDDTGIPSALPKLTTRSTPRGLNACLRLGIAEPVIQAALKSTPLQGEALDVLLTFTAPPRLDRIDGMAHEAAPRDTKAFAALVQPHLDALLAIQDGGLKAKAVELLTQLQLQVPAPVLQQIISDTTARATLRSEALKLMASQHAATPEFATTLDLALKDTSPAELRREALRQLFTHQPDRAITEAAAILEKGDTTTQQLALNLLSTSKDDTLITRWLDRLAEGKAPAAIQLDILEAASTRESLKPRLASLQLGASELLEGGDAARGKDIVTNNLGANCLACHTVEAKEGSQVGPNLKTIGSQKDRPYILESLLNPVAKIAPGYGFVSLTTKDGKTIAAVLEKEDAKQVILRLPDGKKQTFPRDQIASLPPPISVMPPMLGILTKPQIRDVVAYLAGLKGKSGKKSAPSSH